MDVQSIDKKTETLDKILTFLAVTALLVSVILAFVGVILRYQFGVSYQILEEICRYAIVYAVFIYMGPLIKKDEHIKMAFLDEKLTGKSGYMKNTILNVVLFLSLCVLSYASVKWFYSIYQMKLHTLSGEMLMVVPAFAIVIGMALSILYTFMEILKGVHLIKE
ncbi:TRAP transporter small permease subunit [Planococcaceae bacterium Storch 2/2-2]|nr:TRAP transporter small permease subunit [Planococcaceae bacterium Storch 2/2-2]